MQQRNSEQYIHVKWFGNLKFTLSVSVWTWLKRSSPQKCKPNTPYLIPLSNIRSTSKLDGRNFGEQVQVRKQQRECESSFFFLFCCKFCSFNLLSFNIPKHNHLTPINWLKQPGIKCSKRKKWKLAANHGETIAVKQNEHFKQAET